MSINVVVITVVLNGENTIRECINSVKNQDYPHIKHFVIDGCSNDNTVKILQENNISFISEKDNGIYDAFNKGIQESRGDVIHILNADDFYADNNVVSKVVKLFEVYDCDIIHAKAVQIDSTYNPVWVIGADVNRKQLLNKMKVAHPTVFVKKQIYQKYGNFSICFKVAGDHDFMLRIWDKVNRHYIPDVLVKMRIGGASTRQVVLSYKESFAVSILHGQYFIYAILNYCFEIVKHYGVIIPLRLLGFRKK